MKQIAVVLSGLALVLCLSNGFFSAADNSDKIAKAMEALDYSYNELRNAEKNNLECRKKNKSWKGVLKLVLSFKQDKAAEENNSIPLVFQN